MSDTVATSDDGSYANKPPAQQFAYKPPAPPANPKVAMQKRIDEVTRKRSAKNASA